MYTSGSTGNPKGVLVRDKAIVNTLLSMQFLFPMEKGDAFLFKTNTVFDVSLTEILGWFFGLGKVIVLPINYELDPAALLEQININKITHINFVPSMLCALCNYIEVTGKKVKSNLKYIFVAGEAFNVALAHRTKKIFKNACIVNAYGPTEAAVYTTYYIFNGNEKFLPIGKPLPNMTVYVLDKRMFPVPIGVKGELYISGIGLAEGYINNEVISQKAFIKNKIFGNKLAYKTGDVVKLNEDENVEYIGRQDSQIKIRGYRIELGEIESKIKEISCIQNCAVLVIEDNNQEYLVAYLVSKDPNLSLEFMLNEVKTTLENSLPSYMIPRDYVKLDELPINSSGKLDRKSLKDSFDPSQFKSKVHEEISFTEKKLLNAWKKCLGRGNIDVNKSFFDLGGTSLKVIELYFGKGL
ncbi:non-ribosomal peptide synthetase [Rickettsia argasii]|nr:non-ribosomal peptide synthetase [Rickettsia argasii]